MQLQQFYSIHCTERLVSSSVTTACFVDFRKVGEHRPESQLSLVRSRKR